MNLDFCYIDLMCYPDIILHLFAKLVQVHVDLLFLIFFMRSEHYSETMLSEFSKEEYTLHCSFKFHGYILQDIEVHVVRFSNACILSSTGPMKH